MFGFDLALNGIFGRGVAQHWLDRIQLCGGSKDPEPAKEKRPSLCPTGRAGVLLLFVIQVEPNLEQSWDSVIESRKA